MAIGVRGSSLEAAMRSRPKVAPVRGRRSACWRQRSGWGGAGRRYATLGGGGWSGRRKERSVGGELTEEGWRRGTGNSNTDHGFLGGRRAVELWCVSAVLVTAMAGSRGTGGAGSTTGVEAVGVDGVGFTSGLPRGGQRLEDGHRLDVDGGD
jgi:hypothetical protein